MERDVMPVDVVFVGAGPANLAAAYSLGKALEEKGKAGEFEIMVIEKGREVGDHILSGAIMDPRGVKDVFGDDWREKGFPVEADVTTEKVYTLKKGSASKMALIPPPLKNHGNVVVSLSHAVQWMKEQVEELGIMVAEGYPASDVLLDGERVKGVRLVDRGREHDGSEGSTFELGADVEAKVTVLGEGTRGSLTKILTDKLNLKGRNPQVYGTGVKEVWEIPAGRIKAGEVWHTAGWPLLDHQYGGSWVYALSDTKVSIGFVVGLDGRDPGLDPYELTQTWKTHTLLKELLQGGTLIKAGTKTVPEGGWWSRPRSAGDGFLIIGDSGSLLNIARLKGIHTAMKSGQLAGQVIADALIKDNTGADTLRDYETRLQNSWIKDELWRTRNWRQYFAKHGFKFGKYKAGMAWMMGGKITKDFIPIHADHAAMEKGDASSNRDFKPDGDLTFDKLTGVYQAGSVHEENQPSHLLIADTDLCATKCAEEYGNPCERFCPAAVYEMVDAADGKKRMQVNFSNCVHCKTCDIADPYQVITWTVPQDNGGPKYLGL